MEASPQARSRRSRSLLVLSSCLVLPSRALLRAHDAPAVVQHLAVVNSSHEAVVAAGGSASSRMVVNASGSGSMPFSARADPAVGKVFALYYSSYSGAKATSVEATDEYKPAPKAKKAVWNGAMMLPEPTCGLQLRSQTNYGTARRKANLRLAELAVCGLLYGEKVPSCGAGDGQVCQLKLFAPLPSSDKIQEPYLAASMALVAYSKICALRQSSAYNAYKCNIHRSMSAISAGLKVEGGAVTLTGMNTPGVLDLKLTDAYVLKMEHVFLASDSKATYAKTDFSSDVHDVLKWQHAPPKVYFCNDLQCLVTNFMSN